MIDSQQFININGRFTLDESCAICNYRIVSYMKKLRIHATLR